MTSLYGSVPTIEKNLRPADASPNNPKAYTRNTITNVFVVCSALAVLSFVAANGNSSSGLTNKGGLKTNTLRQSSLTVHSRSSRVVVEKVTTDGQFSITASNTLSDNSLGQDYPFLTDRSLVEPFRVTTLALQKNGNDDGVIDSSISISSASWQIDQTSPTRDERVIANIKVINNVTTANKNDGTILFVPITHVFKRLGSYHVKTEVLFAVDDEDNTSSKTMHRDILCRYVRRSLRSLPAMERGAFLDAIRVMMDTGIHEGRALYGAEYRSIELLVGLHLNAAALRKADRLHDGMGFLTQHAAVTSEFELSLQAISPMLAVPYWDYTYDHYIANMTDTPLATLWSMDVWDADWFGRAAGPLRTPTEGRFAYVRVSVNASAQVHSPYGYLRSPWNVNRSPYLNRNHDFCGADFIWNKEGISANSGNGFTSWPSCEVHWQLTYHVDTWYEYVWNSNYQPHGPVHFMIGGWSNCGKLAERVDALGAGMAKDGIYPTPEEEVKHKLALDELKASLVTLPKTMWKDEYVEFPTYCSLDTPEEKCTMICLHSMSNESYRNEIMNTYGEDLFGDWEGNLSTAVKAQLLETLCSTPFAGGDHAEASSPFDPSFWPIHPTVDRLLQWKRLAQPFTNADWLDPEDFYSTSFCKTTNKNTGCEGHNPYDLTEWVTHYENKADGEWVSSYLSNGEIFHLSDPTKSSYHLPYVYDNFEWPHCDLAGWKFRKPA